MKIVGFLGRISKEKNLEILLKIKPDGFRIVLAGPIGAGEESYWQRIKKLVKKYGAEYRGKVNDKNKFLEGCDCLVLPSRGLLESFGLVQIEAMKCGTPVVASNLPGIRVPVKITRMGELFDDENDLVKKIKLVLKRGKKYYQKRVRNLDKFDLSLAIDKYEGCLS